MSRQLAGTLAGAALAAQQAQREVITIAGLREAARTVTDEARRQGCNLLAAASREAAAVIGAALVTGDDSLRALDDDDQPVDDRPVLVVEAVAVSHAKVNARVEQLQTAGWHDVKKFVVRDFAPKIASIGTIQDSMATSEAMAR